MRITKLEIENFKRIKAVAIDFDGSCMTIAGRNAQGKTTILDAIEAALGGGGHLPVDPIHHGAKSARIVIDTDTIKVTRKFTKKGSSLVVQAKDGAKYGSPQAMLDGLIGPLSFDPLEFSRAKPADQAKMLRDLIGIDTTELEAKRSELFASRTIAGRDVRAAKARLDAATNHPDAPAERVSIAELSRNLQAAQERNAKAERAEQLHVDAERLVERMHANVDRLVSDREMAEDSLSATIRQRDAAFAKAGKATVEDAAALVDELSRKLRDAQARSADAVRVTQIADNLDDAAAAQLVIVDKAVSDTEQAEDELAAQIKERDEAKLNAELGGGEDTGAMIFEIESAESVNAQVDANATHARLADDHETASAAYGDLTDAMEVITTDIAAMSASAAYPIDGLEIIDGVVHYGGVDFSQASHAERIRVSTAIGIAGNPELNIVLCREGSMLDDDNLRLVQDLIEAAGAQILVEVAGKGTNPTVVIEDGEVVPRIGAATC